VNVHFESEPHENEEENKTKLQKHILPKIFDEEENRPVQT
jgi:hypothetical protein